MESFTYFPGLKFCTFCICCTCSRSTTSVSMMISPPLSMASFALMTKFTRICSMFTGSARISGRSGFGLSTILTSSPMSLLSSLWSSSIDVFRLILTRSEDSCLLNMSSCFTMLAAFLQMERICSRLYLRGSPGSVLRSPISA